jgi:iron-sulfur-dependent L-serine dehydratase beta subunit
VYKGHATDRALLGGVMKFRTSDSHIKDAFEIAKEKGLKYEFIKKNLGAKWHPNTVRIVLEDGKYKMSVTGSSIGGGMIEILQIDSFKVHIKGRAGRHLSLVVLHDKSPSVMKAVAKNINALNGIKVDEVIGQSLKGKTLSVVGMEGRRILLAEVMELEKIKGVDYARALSKLQKQQ